MNNQVGITDLPATKDLFEIESYINGLVGFLKECKTPMTISIQGPWGTGKTSIMRMVHSKIDPKGRLEENVVSDSTYQCVYFNTWQFSQFNLSNNIAMVMLHQLTNALIGNDKTLGDAFKDAFSKAFSVALQIGAGYLSGGAGVNPKDAFKKEDLDELKDLKNEFQLLINKKLGLTTPGYKLKRKPEEDSKELEKTDPRKRVIFFVDDLDRLNPEKAVELLEVLKNFLDCRNCIFVLAIDYDVVCRGVSGKYGFDMDDPENSRKGKDFFDKIIQVPFKMPVEQYNITSYMKELLGSVYIQEKPLMSLADDYGAYEDLVIASIGTNPRAIKRLVNSFQLIAMVVSFNKEINLEESKLLLFATLCLQELDISLYQAIARKKDKLQPEDLICLTDGSDEDTIKRSYEGLDVSKLDLNMIENYMNRLIDILHKKNAESLEPEELESFTKILKIAAITGNDAPKEVVKKGTSLSRDDVDELQNAKNKAACKGIAEMILQETGLKPNIIKDRPTDVAIGLKYDRPDKLSVSFYETPKGDGFTFWMEARADYMDNLPTDITETLNKRSERVKRKISINKPSATSKNKYLSFTIKNEGATKDDDVRDVRAILRGCNGN